MSAEIIRASFPDRETWLANRDGIGASDLASAIGMSGFKTPLQLWKEKSGFAAPKDLSGNERVDFGNRAEAPLREMFRLMHPEYELTFEPFTILRQKGAYDFLFCTPDGELVEKETGKKGIYESKTATCLSCFDWDKWNCQIPKYYYTQICQQMYCGGFEFAVVWALLLNSDGDGTLRMYRFERTECEPDIQWMLPRAEQFWKHVREGTMPGLSLTV